ncbi:MAG: cupredoxin domain-containing protein [Acidimicrobiales bacterium]
MLTDSSRILLPLSALGLVAALVYGVITGEDAGTTVLVGLAVAASLTALDLLGPTERKIDRAPVVAPDAPPPVDRELDRTSVRLTAPSAAPLFTALGVAAVAAAFAGTDVLAVGGAAIAGLAALAWMAQAMGEHRGRIVDVSPLAIPIGAFLGIGVLMILMSRILLAVTPHASTAVAISVATAVLMGAWVVASQPKLRRMAMGALVGVGAVALGIAGVAGAVHGPRHEEPAGVRQIPVAIRAHNTQFDRAELDFVAGRPALISFDNTDRGTYHNVALYTDQTFQHALFNGTPINRGRIEYRVLGLRPGTYAFHCDFHSNMKGVVHVAG